MTKRAVIIQHHPLETLADNFAGVLLDAGFNLTLVPVFEGAPDFATFDPPDLSEVDLVVALGGPMSANDNYPALIHEMAYLRAAATGDVGNREPTPVIGICLGAQLLSRALGGAVAPTGGYQFGLRKIDVTEAGRTDPAFGKIEIPLGPTLHGEQFTVPPGGTLLAEGTMLRRDGRYARFPMAFRYGLSYGFQFEPQLTLDELRVWNRELAGDYKLMGERFDPQEEAARNLREFTVFARFHEAQMARMLRALLAQAGLIVAEPNVGRRDRVSAVVAKNAEPTSIFPLSGRGTQIQYLAYDERIDVRWGDTRFAFTANDIATILGEFFESQGEWYQLGASMTDPPREGLGYFVSTRFRGLTPRHASAIAAILVNEGRLQSRGARPIELRRV